MKDYLSHIIDRSRGGVGIKPRLKALFEPDGEEPAQREFGIAVEREKSGSRAVDARRKNSLPPFKKTNERPEEIKNGAAAPIPERKEAAPRMEKALTRHETVSDPDQTREATKAAGPNRPAGISFAPQTAIVGIVGADQDPVSKSIEKETHQSTGKEAAPVVRVSIGRVEVKAVLPQAPAFPRKPARQNKPMLTLDDYLKQRRERKP
jgi:hypothetical protein